MTDFILPVDLIPNAVEWRMIDNSGVFQSPLSGTVRRVSRPGNRWGCRLTFNNIKGTNRNRLMALIASLRGRTNSLWVTDQSSPLRGSMSAPEFYTNSDFSNGVASWSIVGGTALSSAGRARLRATATLTEVDFYQTLVPSISQPHALRVFYIDGSGSAGVYIGPAIDGGLINNYSTTLRGYNFASGIPINVGGGGYYAAVVLSASTWIAGSTIDIAFASMARCLQVDNGSNTCTYSQEIDNAAWSKNNFASTTANVGVAPDGTSTADRVTENTTPSVVHWIAQSPARANLAMEICGYGYFKSSVAPVRDIRVAVGDGANYGYAFFSMSNGTVSSVTNVGTVTNCRAFSKDMGNGWYFCSVVCRLPAGTTTSFVQYDLLSGGSNSYTGTTGAIDVWRLGQSVSGVPTRGALTTSAAVASGTAQTGGAIYVKGGPVSTNGALVAGDMVEITEGPVKTTAGTSQLVRLTADLDFDAAGMGYMQFEPSIRTSPADNAAIIVQKPLCKMLLANSEVGWPTRPGLWSDFVLDLVEDIT